MNCCSFFKNVALSGTPCRVAEAVFPDGVRWPLCAGHAQELRESMERIKREKIFTDCPPEARAALAQGRLMKIRRLDEKHR